MFNIDELTVGQIKDIQRMCGNTSKSKSPYEIGKNYLIRTATMIDVGRLVEVTDQELILEDAAWIADTGRFNEALKNGTFNEVEPFPDGRVIVGRASVVDACEFNHKLQRIVK